MLLRLTNNSNAILHKIEVAHPAARNTIELSQTQDEEVRACIWAS
jgi:chaperonin GroEL (HSP60 family)